MRSNLVSVDRSARHKALQAVFFRDRRTAQAREKPAYARTRLMIYAFRVCEPLHRCCPRRSISNNSGRRSYRQQETAAFQIETMNYVLFRVRFFQQGFAVISFLAAHPYAFLQRFARFVRFVRLVRLVCPRSVIRDRCDMTWGG